MSCVLQYGWNMLGDDVHWLYTYDNIINNNKFGVPSNLQSIKSYRKYNSYRYQVLYGLITNFNFTFVNSATWEVTIQFQSV